MRKRGSPPKLFLQHSARDRTRGSSDSGHQEEWKREVRG